MIVHLIDNMASAQGGYRTPPKTPFGGGSMLDAGFQCLSQLRESVGRFVTTRPTQRNDPPSTPSSLGTSAHKASELSTTSTITPVVSNIRIQQKQTSPALSLDLPTSSSPTVINNDPPPLSFTASSACNSFTESIPIITTPSASTNNDPDGSIGPGINLFGPSSIGTQLRNQEQTMDVNLNNCMKEIQSTNSDAISGITTVVTPYLWENHMEISLMIKYNELSRTARKHVKEMVDLHYAVTNELPQTLNYAYMKITEAMERRQNGISSQDLTIHPHSNSEPKPDSVSSEPIPDPVKSKTIPNPIKSEPVPNTVKSKSNPND